MDRKPTAWLAAVLNFVFPPFGLLYAGRPLWALVFFAAAIPLALANAAHLLGWWGTLLNYAMLGAGSLLAYRAAKNTAGIRHWYSRWYGLIGIALAVSIPMVAVRVFFYEPFKAPSTSMEPSVPRGSFLVVQKYGYGHYSSYGMRFFSRPVTAQVKRGDILAFDFPVDPSQTYLKRVVGLPGDRIEYRDKHVFVNGHDSRGAQLGDYELADRPVSFQRFHDKLDDTEFDVLQQADARGLQTEPNTFPFRDRCTYSAGEFTCTVPAGNFFVMGDNRDNSFDSRYWGFVRSGQVLGKVVKVFP